MKKIVYVLLAMLCLSFTAPATFAQTDSTRKSKHVPKEVTVYVTKTGGKYHRSNCSYLRKSSIPMKKSDAIAAGYTACSRCNP
jgi:hypothetical protein